MSTLDPPGEQLALDVGGEQPLLLVPVDRHGRALAPIDVSECERHGGGWGEATAWAYVAIRAANQLAPGAPDPDVLTAGLRARATLLALTGRQLEAR